MNQSCSNERARFRSEQSQRFALLAIGVLLALSCDRPRPVQSATPPATKNQFAELMQKQPPFPDAHANPKPTPDVLGCYSVAMTPDLGSGFNVPSNIELTDSPGGTLQFHSLYVARTPLRMKASWRPYTENEIRIALSDFSSGWTMELHREKNGYSGAGLWVSHTLERREVEVRLARAECTSALAEVTYSPNARRRRQPGESFKTLCEAFPESGDIVRFTKGMTPPQRVSYRAPKFSGKITVSGILIASLVITDTGRVSRIEIERSASDQFDALFIEEMKSAQFRPAQRDGKNVSVCMNYTSMPHVR